MRHYPQSQLLRAVEALIGLVGLSTVVVFAGETVDARLVKVLSEPFLDQAQEQVEPYTGRLTMTGGDSRR